MTEDPAAYVRALFGTDEEPETPVEPTTPPNHVPTEGQPLDPGAGGDAELREFTRQLFTSTAATD